MNRSVLIAVLLAFTGALFAHASAHAQAYPQRPIRFIVPFAPGGTSDIIGRLLGAKLAEDLGQSVVVDNRGGAGSTLGTAIAANSPPDGHTIIVNHVGIAINETLYPKLAYNAVKDLAPISRVGDTPNAVVVYKGFPAATMKEFIAIAKKYPGKFDYGSGGSGSAGHLSVALLEDLGALKFNHVPYKGGGPSVAATISGEVHFAIPAFPTAVSHVKAGRLRMIAVTGTERNPIMPDVPTVAESGVPDYEFVIWFGVFAPAGTPPAVIARLNKAIVNSLALPDLQQQLATQGLEPRTSTPEALAKLLQADIAQWARIIKAAGIRLN
jgi:tripartite-type tricarboxylate transporter receptor subunit TctC